MQFGRREKTILVELLIIIFVAYALINTWLRIFRMDDWPVGSGMLMYYTNWSNILAAAVQVISLLCLWKGITIPRLVGVLKLAAVVMLTLTFLVVVAVLCPSDGQLVLLDPNGMIFLHFVVPVLAAVDLLFLTDMGAPSKQDTVLQIVPSLMYILGVVIVMVSMGNDSLAPYPFLRIYTQPVYVTVLWMAGLALLTLALSVVYSRLFPRTNPSAAGTRA